jgi:hypothetical protein
MIVEIWRHNDLNLPVRFSVGDQPQFIGADGNMITVADSPPVKSINFYETGAFGGKAYRGPCYVVQFESSPARRIIPIDDVKDILWVNPEKPINATPTLED